MSIQNISMGTETLHLVDCSLAPDTVNLPAISSVNHGTVHIVKKIDSTHNQMTIIPNGTDLIEGNTQWILNNQYESFWAVIDNTNKQWWLIGRYQQ